MCGIIALIAVLNIAGFLFSLILSPWHKVQYVFTIYPSSLSFSTAESADVQQRILLISGVKKCTLESNKVKVDMDVEKEFDFKEVNNVIIEAVIEILNDHLRKKATRFSSVTVSYSIVQ